MHRLQPASLASISNSASQGWTNDVNLGVSMLLSIKWDDLSTCLRDLCFASGKGVAALHGRTKPPSAEQCARQYPSAPPRSLFPLSRFVQTFAAGEVSQRWGGGEHLVRSGPLCAARECLYCVTVCTRRCTRPAFIHQGALGVPPLSQACSGPSAQGPCLHGWL